MGGAGGGVAMDQLLAELLLDGLTAVMPASGGYDLNYSGDGWFRVTVYLAGDEQISIGSTLGYFEAAEQVVRESARRRLIEEPGMEVEGGRSANS